MSKTSKTYYTPSQVNNIMMKSLRAKLANLALLSLIALSACNANPGQIGSQVLGDDEMHHGEQIVSEQPLSASINKIDARSYIKVVLRYADTPMLKITAPSAERKLTIKEEQDGRLVIFEDKKQFHTQDGAFLVEVFTPTALESLKAGGASVVEITDAHLQDRVEIDLAGASRLLASTLSISQELSLDVSGASHLAIDTLTSGELDLDCSGASKVELPNLKLRELEADCSGASNLEIAGEVDKAKLDASGASDIDAAKLLCHRGEISASGASEINVNVDQEISLEASGASEIYYFGTPKVLSISNSGSSTIKNKS